MPTDTSERGLERLICTAQPGHPCDSPLGPTVGEPPARYGECALSGGLGPVSYRFEITANVLERFVAA